MKVSDHMKYQRGGRKDQTPDSRAARREFAKVLYRQSKRLAAKRKREAQAA